MTRVFLATVLCFTVALMGITGVHAHVLAPEASAEHTAAHSHHGAYVVSIVDADHQNDHDEDGDVDIEPVVKAMGKATFAAPVAIIATLLALLIVAVRSPSLLLSKRPPLRPPKPPLRYFLLPPSHAPPASLHY